MLIGEQHRRRSGFGLSALSRASPLSQDNEGITVEGEEEGKNAKEAGAKTKMMDVEPAVLMEQLMSVQSLLERFEKRLLVRESELIKKEKEATEQLEKLRTVVVM